MSDDLIEWLDAATDDEVLAFAEAFAPHDPETCETCRDAEA